MVAHAGRLPQILVSWRSAGLEQVVDKHNAVGDDTIITNGDQFAHEGMRLDFASIPDHDILLNFHKRADKRIIADLETVKIRRLNYRHVLSEFNIPNLGID